MKKLCVIAAVLFGMAGSLWASDVPVVQMAYSHVTHHQAFMVAMARGEEAKDLGVWLKPVIDKEKYDIYVNGEKKARLVLNSIKGGSEVATLFAQKHLDLTVSSFPAMLSGIDRGTAIKVMAPVQADGIAMVSRSDIDVVGWENFLTYVKASEKPVVVGYHSPTSAPKILFEAAMDEAGLRLTGDAYASKKDADILMMDLRGTANIIPAMAAKQIEFAVAPAPTPEIVESKSQGHIVLQLRELPPVGRWQNFPCCVIAGRTEFVEAHPEAVKAFIDMMTASSEWCMANPQLSAEITADWLGVPAEVIAAAKMTLSTKVTKDWLKNAALYPEMLNRLGQCTGALKDKSLDDVADLVFDFQFVEIEQQ